MSAEQSPGGQLVQDHHLLAGVDVRIGESASVSQRDAQRAEVIRRHLVQGDVAVSVAAGNREILDRRERARQRALEQLLGQARQLRRQQAEERLSLIATR